MGISLGMVGLGSFGSVFVPLFASHPLVSRIALCDREPERIAKFAGSLFLKDKFKPSDAYNSLEEICKSDLDALVIITQPWLHAPQCIQAMESGKDVYSAVPIISIPDGDEILEWCDKLIETSKRTGKNYMLGETTYYRPQAMFCRRKAKENAFGNFIYAEGEYFHDRDTGALRTVANLRENSKAGREWKELVKKKYTDRGIRNGPMHYPTHSTSGPVCVMNAHAVKVTAYGYLSKDPSFDRPVITNETALFKMSNDAVVRICEFREQAGSIADHETFRILGTRGSYVERKWHEVARELPLDEKLTRPLKTMELTDEEMRDPLPSEVVAGYMKLSDMKSGPNADFIPVGHGGSHHYLVHEFVSSVAEKRMPAINIWEAARYMVMGVMAHKSALKDGETLSVPDWGDAPCK
ncbi:MAG TPA: Gfo/Idh/MocA family oxidoreductase [bacterium]|nr:Gfo/Idh/MocA family oxidoreductase [bacterium]